jgi:hypothetical protein
MSVPENKFPKFYLRKTYLQIFYTVSNYSIAKNKLNFRGVIPLHTFFMFIYAQHTTHAK